MNRASKLFLFIGIFNALTGFSLLAEEMPKNKQETISNKEKSEKSINEYPTNLEYYDNIHWIQDIHESVSDSVFQSAKWFDDFFIDGDSKKSNPKTNARIRLGWKPKSRNLGSADVRFKIKVTLPHFQDKVDLIFSDNADAEESQLPLEGISTRPDINEESFAAAVRFVHKNKENSYTDSRIGISSADIFLRARHKRRFIWNDHHGFKLEPSVYYFLDDGLGAKLLLEYDYQLNEKQQFRINYSMRGSESFHGIRWKHGFYRLSQINDTTASVLGIQVQGERNGERGFFIEKYTLSYRYRFNAIRKWLYFEIEPFLEWPENENYTTTPGIAFRVDGYFYKG